MLSAMTRVWLREVVTNVKITWYMFSSSLLIFFFSSSFSLFDCEGGKTEVCKTEKIVQFPMKEKITIWEPYSSM